MPDDEDVLYGPLNNANQLARVGEMVSRTPSHAEVVTGGARPAGDGYFYEPTVVAGLEQGDEMIQDEIFGPVITVQRFSDEAQAIEWANGVEYGLASSVWQKDRPRHGCQGARLRCVWINTHIPLVAEMPHGGYKKSGYGKDLSAYARRLHPHRARWPTSIRTVGMGEHRTLTGENAYAYTDGR